MKNLPTFLPNFKTKKIGAVVFTILLLGTLLTIPAAAINLRTNHKLVNLLLINKKGEINPLDTVSTEDNGGPIWLDSYYVRPEEGMIPTDSFKDIGYNTDAGNNILKSFVVYVNEPVDETIPGRGRTGSLGNGDSEDWYRFEVCQGQTITVSVSGGMSFELRDSSNNPFQNGGIAQENGYYYMRIFGGSGDYSFTVTLDGQNDGNKGSDAGNNINNAMSITPGTYPGYMSYYDQEDWYSFDVNSGQGIFIDLESPDKSDYDVYLYNPSGKEVHSARYYGDDHLEYPADVTGTWKIKICMFPGWDESKWPDNYFLYGSGPYKLTLKIGGSAQSPPGPIPQPEIVPVAQTFKITNDPNSNEDEYSFLAAVPNAVYKRGGKLYVSPVVYIGDSTKTHWFGTADDTTNYLLDDWNTYLSRHGYLPKIVKVDKNPVKAAANLATTNWEKSDTAVIAVDGSRFLDDWNTVLDKDATLNVKTKKTIASPGDEKFHEIAGYQAIQMWIGKEWGAMTIYAYGSNCPAVGLITPRFELGTEEEWPHPFDGPGDNTNIYYPIATPGIYWPLLDGNSGFDTFEITRYTGDRYKIPISDTDTSLRVTVTTPTDSYLEVFLVDPTGQVRRPNIPSWNGGPINPLHIWNGDHHNGFEKWRRWEPDLSKTHTVEINYPMTGKWTVIVAPHYPYGQEKTSDSIPYHITAEIRKHNPKRINAGLSAANGAVIASQIHVPLLYVTENSVPVETQEALNKLGVKKIYFVNLNKVSNAKISGDVTELTSMRDVIKTTKTHTKNMKTTAQSENAIIITSFGTENGYFAPAGLAAAYHGANVLNIGEVPDAYNYLDKATSFRLYSGGWYHGMRATGYLGTMSEPLNWLQIIKNLLNGELPPLGLEQDLRWHGAVYNEIRDWINSQGLDGPGQEIFIFVGPRDTDIRTNIVRIMTGAESYAGHIPFELPSLDAALICRDILYPAIIYANPGRNVTTSQFMNFPDGRQWTTNDGTRHHVYSTRVLKETFSSHGRFYEGHCIWDSWLERINQGAASNYYSGHGTGGSGISAQYANVAESFPDAELRHEHLYDFDWWDGWRGYMYDDKQTKTPRDGGFTWYNPKEPNLYDIIHFKWVDQLLNNLHSEFEMWMSCTTAQHFGPEIYLEHGSAVYYGNAATGLCPQADLLDDQWMTDMFVNGLSIGEAFSKYVWLHERDYTTQDDTSLYGTSSMQVHNIQCIYGDPTLILYSPEWTEPIPVSP